MDKAIRQMIRQGFSPRQVAESTCKTRREVEAIFSKDRRNRRMKYVAITATLLLVLAAGATIWSLTKPNNQPDSALPLSRQIQSEESVIHITNGMRNVKFSIREAKETFWQLSDMVDPDRPENAYFPPYLKDRLSWIRQNAAVGPSYYLPSTWENGSIDNGEGVGMMSANYCQFQAGEQPCVTAFIIPMMVLMRLDENFLLEKPNRAFVQTFAIFLAHEGIHLERERNYFQPFIPGEVLYAEELRTWFKTIRDIVHPLRQNGEDTFPEFANLDNKLAACDYRLPCPEFEDAIHQKVTDGF